MALAISTVTASIAALSVSGLAIKDIDEVPTAVDPRQPTLFPDDVFISGFSMTRDSFGGGTAKMTVTYILSYRLCYAPVGSGRTKSLGPFSGLVDMIADIWDAILAINTFSGGIDIQPLDPGNMPAVTDPAGNNFFGCTLSFRVTEFVN